MTEPTRYSAEQMLAEAWFLDGLLDSELWRSVANGTTTHVAVKMLRQAAETEREREAWLNSLGGHGLGDVSRRPGPSFESPSKTELVVSQSVGGGSPTMVVGNGTRPIHPTYYVKHPEGSYSVDDTLQAEVERLTKDRDEARQIARRWHDGYDIDENDFAFDAAIIANWPKE